jgi:hypothetical protein
MEIKVPANLGPLAGGSEQKFQVHAGFSQIVFL